MKTDTAASDLIGVMALIAVFVMAAAILGVTLLSIPPGDAAPAMIARSVVTGDGKFSLSHDGGDPLVKGHFAILIDGVDRTDNFSIDGNSDWTSWETGQIITFDNELPRGAHVQIAGESVGRTGGDWLLHVIPTVDPIQIPLIADFTVDVTSGSAPLTVQFTDISSGNPIRWAWNFGDGATSTEQNPTHTYTTPRTYTVTLTVINGYDEEDTRTREDYIRVTENSFIDFIIDENVFIYGTALQFNGNNVNGPNATVVVTGGLKTNDLNGGASINVSNIYIDGDVTLDGGSAGLGSKTEPGAIYINGDLTLVNGGRDIYGDVYINGSFRLNDARIHGNIYVDGDLALEWGVPEIAENARIYYTGILIPISDYYDAGILAKCIHQETVPGFTIPDQGIPSTKPAEWYTSRGYAPSGDLTNNLKIFAPSYSSTVWRETATGVIIIASTGDITITELGGSGVTGVFFAPNGKVTFNGAFLEGVVIARDGFEITSGGTTVTFKNLEKYITNPADYPF